MKLIAFGASTSSKSINKILATYAASLLDDAETEIIDLNDYELPIFSEDTERDIGKPQAAANFLDKIGQADALIVSFAEHNGNYPAAYKNLFDWCTRINPKVFQSKPMVLLATSPGGRGAKSVLDIAENSLPRFGGEILATLSVPNFYDNFDLKTMQLSDEHLRDALFVAVEKLL